MGRMGRYTKVWLPDEVESSAIVEWEPQYTNVLNHGFVGLQDFMGDDAAVVQAARVSYGKGTKAKSSDEGLIRYLMRHRHTTPFEMCEVKFHVKAPIFVFRQWHRHRTASINEESGRYSELRDEFFLPDVDHCAPQSTSNKQGRQDTQLSTNDFNAVYSAIEQAYEDAFQTYNYLLGKGTPPDKINQRKLWLEEAALKSIRKVQDESQNTDNPISFSEEQVKEKVQEWFEANELAVTGPDFPGIAKELARVVMPVATYSQMYWKTNLHNLMHFLKLRTDPHAQWEIRAYANAMCDLIQPIFPISMKAFDDYNRNAVLLSHQEIETLRWYFQMHPDSAPNLLAHLKSQTGVSDRELGDFQKRLYG
jgi:thymidylate synthase (FAD)